MDAHSCAEPLCGFEHTQKLTVVDVQRIVGEEDLEAAYACLDQLWDFLAEYGIRRIGDDLVEGVIDRRTRGARSIVVEMG
jgi:hypothetical protein